MPEQIKLVATGWHHSLKSYLESEQAKIDRPGFVIDRNGTIHGGTSSSGARREDECVEGLGWVIALVNVGPVVLYAGRWYPAAPDHETGRFGRIAGADPVRVPYEYCTCKPYHGCTHYEMMGDRQLQALRSLLKSLLSQFHLQFPYDNQLGEICPRALAGKSGIYFASSYDKRRSDIHPQIELLHLIKSLAQ